jgi:TolB-like protein/class 3 adenylate cyclase/Tfp pilus assembly protein PilF
MAEGGKERRLAAIVSVDVVGYSRLMGADEQGTLAALTGHRDAMAPLVERHGGRLVGQAGDGLLFEFPSVVEAVTCAMEVQSAMAVRNQYLPDDKKMLSRVGINLGDIMVDGDDIFGDGVNVAARIEALAEPGGICISGSVHEQVRDRMDIRLTDMGEVEVKNIARPVRVFRVLGEGKPAEAPMPARTMGWKFGAAALVVITVIAAGAAVFWRQQPASDPAVPSTTASVLSGKPSIAVLPFANMSADKAQESFADGISEDLTTQLSKLSGLLVISRTSTFKYKGQKIDIRQIARELGVRYILEGSVRRGGNQLRINAQLIEAGTGGHIWAETYDGAVGDVFALQDRINKNIVSALKIHLAGKEPERIIDRGTNNIEAHEAFQRGERLRIYSKANVYTEAVDEYENAISLDPRFADARAALGHILFAWANSGDAWATKRDMLAKAQVLADEALLMKEVPLGFLLQARISLFQKLKHEQALSAARRALALDPNLAEAHATLGEILLYDGQLDEALNSLDQAARLNPGFPEFYRFLKGQVKFHQGKYEAALEDMAGFCPTAATRAYSTLCAFYQASAYAHIGNIAKAKSFFIGNMATLSTMASLSTMIAVRYPFKSSGDVEKLLEGLAKFRPK